MTDVFKVVREDDGETSVVCEPRTSFKTLTQAVLTIGSPWEGQLLWGGELDDDGQIWPPFDLEDEFGSLLITEEGSEPVLEGRVIDLAIVLDNVRRFQDHDELGVVWRFVGWTSLAHGV